MKIYKVAQRFTGEIYIAELEITEHPKTFVENKTTDAFEYRRFFQKDEVFLLPQEAVIASVEANQAALKLKEENIIALKDRIEKTKLLMKDC